MEFGYTQHHIQKECQRTYRQVRILCTPKWWRGKQMPRLSKNASQTYPNILQVASTGSQSLLPARQFPITCPSRHEIGKNGAILFFSLSLDMQQRNMPLRTNSVSFQWLQGTDRSKTQSLLKMGVNDMLFLHTSTSREEALNKEGMLKSSTTIWVS